MILSNEAIVYWVNEWGWVTLLLGLFQGGGFLLHKDPGLGEERKTVTDPGTLDPNGGDRMLLRDLGISDMCLVVLFSHPPILAYICRIGGGPCDLKYQGLGTLSPTAALTMLDESGILFAFLPLPAIQMKFQSEPHTPAEWFPGENYNPELGWGVAIKTDRYHW